MNYSYGNNIEIVNDSSLPARYSLVLQDDSGQSIYSYTSKNPSGVIAAKSSLLIDLELQIKRLGEVNFPVFVKILGDEQEPLVVDISAIGFGPNMSLSTSEINFGKVVVLKEVPMTFQLRNDSPIHAEFSCSIASESSVFRVEPVNGTIKPGKEVIFTVTALLDDCLQFADMLKINVLSDSVHEVQMIARGFGSTITFDQRLLSVDFKDVLSNRECSMEFSMTNRGRRAQTINWQGDDSKRFAMAKDLAQTVFDVVPNRFVLKPGASHMIHLRGYSDKALSAKEILACYSTIDKDPSRRHILNSQVTANFINPLLDISPTSLSFVSVHTVDDDFRLSFKDLTLKNVSSLPLHISFRCRDPYSIITNELDQGLLLPGSSTTVVVQFDPSYNSKRISTKEHSKIAICYSEHPQKDIVEVFSEMTFPNISISEATVQFGCIPRNTEQKRSFTMKNTSELPVNFNWCFVEGTFKAELQKGQDPTTIDIPPCQVFDMMPLSGTLLPGESQNVEANFYGHLGKFRATALCDVVGGPKYEMELIGEASLVDFHIDRRKLDFGLRPYQEIAEQEIVLSNIGHVAFDFNVVIPTRKGLNQKVMVFPSIGQIPSFGKQKLTVRFSPCVPEAVNEYFLIHAAHYEPAKIYVSGNGMYPDTSLDLPRVPDERFDEILSTMEKNLKSRPVSSDGEAGEKVIDETMRAEIERLLLKERTMTFLDELGEDLKQRGAVTSRIKYAGSSVIAHKGLGSREKKHSSLSETSQVQISSYICDFGNVIRNTMKKKTFKFFNRSSSTISFSLDRSQLSGTGFMLESDKLKVPAGESIDFHVAFQIKGASVESYHSSITVPICIWHGPTILLLLKAEVTVPDLTVSSRQVTFGEVLCGQRKTITLALTNYNSVKCDWSAETYPVDTFSVKESKSRRRKEVELAQNQVKKKITPSQLRDVVMEPSSGTLLPGEVTTMMLRFSPNEDKDYEMLVGIKMNLNPRLLNIHVSGKGAKLSVQFEPESLSLGPVLPCSDPIETRVKVFNPTNYPVEIFSLDFDQQYLEEEEALRKVDFHGSDILYTLEESEPGNTQSLAKPKITATESLAKEQEPQPPTSIIIIGPPFSGKTTQAKKICKAYGNIYLRLDDIFDAYRQEHGEIPDENTVAALSDSEERVNNGRSMPTEDTTEECPNLPNESNELQSVLSDELVEEVVRSRLLQEDCQKHGYVIDGLEGKYTESPIAIVRTIIKCSEKRKPILLNIQADVALVSEREIKLLKVSGDKDAELFQFKGITDEDYENMTLEGMMKYDECVIEYKRRLKENSERRRRERQIWEDSLNEKRDQEEARKRKAMAQMKKVVPPPASNSVQPPIKEQPVKPIQSSTIVKPEAKPTRAGLTSPKPVVKKEEERAQPATSRSSLLDSIDEFFYDSTLRRYENYMSRFETIRNWLKEGEKSTVPKQPEKKAVKGKPGQAPNTAQQTQSLDTTLSNAVPAEEDLLSLLSEINGKQSKNSVFNQLATYLPPLQISDKKVTVESLPPPFTERIVSYPPDRNDTTQSSKFFTLSPSQSASTETEDELHADAHQREVGLKKPNKDDEEGDRYRWVIPPNESKEIMTRFTSPDVGKFEQNISFEIVGARGKISLKCVGYCQHAVINFDYRRLFGKWRKTKEEKAIIHGEYVLSTGTYEYGPLLQGKPRDKDKSSDNFASISFSNPTKTEIKLNFGMKNDSKGETFIFDSPTMDLAPGQSQTFNVWAYPKNAGLIEDALVCCVKDNPEPYIIKVSCIGVRPDIEIDKKQLSFDKLLVGRNEQKELHLKNNSMLPVGWRLIGLDLLGDEFEISSSEGMLEPYQDSIVTASFCAVKPSVVKRSVKIEVFDYERTNATLVDYQILITAEAYDISVDMHFSKGFEGLDFGVLKVSEEGKQSCTLKNKGKYEVGYRFNFDSKYISDLFTISPQQGILQPSDKPYNIQVTFKAPKEISIRDSAGLKCVWFEPNSSEVTSTQNIKLSARAVYSKFSIMPVRDLNFGSLVHGIKGTRHFVIENLGEFDFKYSIYKMTQGMMDGKGAKGKGKGRPGSPPGASRSPVKLNVKQTDAANFGSFVVFPTSGICQGGQKQQITVEFNPENPGCFEEVVAIDISEKSPIEPDVLEYHLIGESHVPGINTTDFPSIFEEQTVCKRMELFGHQTCTYAEDDRVFYFGAYLTGQTAHVRFKITNPFKVACDVQISTRPRSKTKSETSDFAFDVEPKKLNIQSHEYKYVTVSFQPSTIQSYAGIFEAVVENVSDHKNKTLSFELRGEGTLPRVTVEKPVVRTKTGIQVLKFARSLLGKTQKMPIVIKNEGIISAKVKLEWNFKSSDELECTGLNITHTMKPLEVKSFEATYRPTQIGKADADIKLKVLDNTFEDTSISLQGESYQGDLTFDNIPNNTTGENEISFSECQLRKSKVLKFDITNHSLEHARLAWVENQDFLISPSIMHIKPSSEKEVSISFTPRQPCQLTKVPLTCKISKIKYTHAGAEANWDNRQKINGWVATEAPGKTLPIAPESMPEPAHEIIPNTQIEQILYANALADYCSYECSTSRIDFKPTFMFQTRTFKIQVKNTGKVAIKYSFMLFDEEGNPLNIESSQCPFTVEPMTGNVDVNGTLNASVKFSPVEEDEYSDYHLVLMAPNLDRDMVPLNISLFGTSLRPFCHFELEQSDYIANERSTDLSTTSSVPLVLEAGTRVIEFVSCGIKVRNTRKFYICNPTNIAWEFYWVCTAGNETEVFRCITPKGHVLPGKKFEITFDFWPENVEITVLS